MKVLVYKHSLKNSLKKIKKSREEKFKPMLDFPFLQI